MTLTLAIMRIRSFELTSYVRVSQYSAAQDQNHITLHLVL